jgi:cystathionine beta-lyase/cystathionine gamma-synthase
VSDRLESLRLDRPVYECGTGAGAQNEAMHYHLGITDRMVRISVGIEDTDDLIADLKVALR